MMPSSIPGYMKSRQSTTQMTIKAEMNLCYTNVGAILLNGRLNNDLS